MKYFAYGSNMSFKRLKQRISSLKRIGTYVLYEHDLRFHKVSDYDGSGKGDSYYTGRKNDEVIGVLYEISRSAKLELDDIEGPGYNVKEITVHPLDNGSTEQAITYYATNIDASLRPYQWYLNHLLVGAQEAELPAHYINRIKNIKSLEDPDKQRVADELAIYE